MSMLIFVSHFEERQGTESSTNNKRRGLKMCFVFSSAKSEEKGVESARLVVRNALPALAKLIHFTWRRGRISRQNSKKLFHHCSRLHCCAFLFARQAAASTTENY
jgi:hypothetical protein